MASIAVATMTLARSPREAAVLERSLRRLSGHGWPIFITDGGSSDAFLASIRRLPNVSLQHSAGLVSQVQRSVGVALRCGASFVLYTEPDKETFFDTGIGGFVARAENASPTLVRLAARSPESFGTFPSHQRFTEGVINALCGDAFGRRGDYSYGPFLLSRVAAFRVADAPLDLGWGWRHFLFAVAHRLGHSPLMLEGNYECPLRERREDLNDRAYRDRQLQENCSGLLQGLSTPLASSGSLSFGWN